MTKSSAISLTMLGAMGLYMITACTVDPTSSPEPYWVRLAAQGPRGLRDMMDRETRHYAPGAVTIWCYGAYANGSDEAICKVMESFGYQGIWHVRLEADSQARTVLFMREPVQIGCVALNQVEKTERILWLALVPHALDLSMGYYIVVPSNYAEMAVELLSKDEELKKCVNWNGIGGTYSGKAR